MNKQVILKPAKTYSFALKQMNRAVRELGEEVAEEIGIEVLRVNEIYYLVKNVYQPTPFDTIWNTEDATERITVAKLMGRVDA